MNNEQMENAHEHMDHTDEHDMDDAGAILEVVECVDVVSEAVWADGLIEQVRRYPVLWDRSRRDYGHAEKSSVIWALIGEALSRSAEYCSKQWKTLRDGYVRRLKCVRRLAYHGLTPRKPRWRHFEAMSFLDAHVSHRGGQVDSRTEDQLSTCSIKDVTFYGTEADMAPNKNELGGMGKAGPSHVHASRLSEEPIALFSRVGLGQIAVIQDADTHGGGHLENQDGGDHKNRRVIQDGDESSGDRLQLSEGEYILARDGEENVVHIIIEGSRSDVTESGVDTTEIETSAAVEAVVRDSPSSSESGQNTDTIQNADTSPKAGTSQRADTCRKSDDADCDSNIVSSTNEAVPKVNPSATQKRSHHVLEIGNESDEENDIECGSEFKRNKCESSKSNDDDESKRERLVSNSKGGLSSSSSDENMLFAQYVAKALAGLPTNTRARTKLKIQQILCEAELAIE